MRRKKRASPTAAAIKLIIKDLDKWRQLGHDPTAILNYSIAGNYTGVFEPKGNANGQARRDRKSGHDKFFDAGASLIGDILGSAEGGDDYPATLQIGGPLLPS